MAEITYQMVLSTLQTVGLLVGISYYIMVLRNQQKSQKHAEETRKIQLITQIADLTSADYQRTANDLILYEWTDYADFEKKYGSDNNPSFADRYAIWSTFDNIGYYLKEGLVDIETIIGATAGTMGMLWAWKKFEPIILEQRRYYKQPKLFSSWEYLYDQMTNYYEKEGIPDIKPEKYSSYIPENTQ